MDADYWKSVIYEGLTDYENLLIVAARVAGYAEFFPCYSMTGNSDYSQGKATLDGAKNYLDTLGAFSKKRLAYLSVEEV